MSPVRLSLAVDPSTDHLLGPPDAPVTLVVYGDYQCSYCGHAEVALREIRERLEGRICLVFRNLPLIDVHPHAEHAALAAEAAARQDRFWPMHDLLYAHQDALADEDLDRYAAQLGLDLDRFRVDTSPSAEVAAKLQRDAESALESGVSGTPSFFVNGSAYDGDYDADSLGAVLAKAAST
ncbi:MAG: cyclic nucleotide-binding protein [Solirubrobacterales bacterium]|nr:cyclic nucleotide-binding protein [Solirubrobacterales bacterium]